jgi:hypothetical protein
MRTLLCVLALLLAGCGTMPRSNSTEKLEVRERIYNPSFNFYGVAYQDSIWEEVYIWDTIFQTDTIRTTFNEITKVQSVRLSSKPDTLRDTTYIKADTVTHFVDKVEYKEVIPTWMWLALIGLLLLCFFLIKIRK